MKYSFTYDQVVCRRYQQAIDQMDIEGQKMAEEELRRMESRCIIRICLTGYGEDFDDKFIKSTKSWFEIKVLFGSLIRL